MNSTIICIATTLHEKHENLSTIYYSISNLNYRYSTSPFEFLAQDFVHVRPTHQIVYSHPA